MSAIAEQILGSKDRRIAIVDVPEWGTEEAPMKVRVRSWNAGQRADFDNETALLSDHLSQTERIKLAAPRVVAWCLVDESNEPAFTVPTIEAIEEAAKAGDVKAALGVYYAIAAKEDSAIQKLFGVACDLNGTSTKAQYEIEKN